MLGNRKWTLIQTIYDFFILNVDLLIPETILFSPNPRMQIRPFCQKFLPGLKFGTILVTRMGRNHHEIFLMGFLVPVL